MWLLVLNEIRYQNILPFSYNASSWWRLLIIQMAIVGLEQLFLKSLLLMVQLNQQCVSSSHIFWCLLPVGLLPVIFPFNINLSISLCVLNKRYFLIICNSSLSLLIFSRVHLFFFESKVFLVFCQCWYISKAQILFFSVLGSSIQFSQPYMKMENS